MIEKHDLSAVKAQLKLFLSPQDFFPNIKDYTNLAAVNERKESFFFHALACKNDTMIRYLFTEISLPERVIDLVTTNDETLLGKAIENGLTDIVKILLSRGANNNKAGSHTPMSIAAQQGHVEIIELLLTAHAEINLPENNGSYPIHNACIYNQFEAAQLLLASGAHCSLVNNKGESAIQIAIKNNNPKMVFLLLSYGAGIAIDFPTDKQAYALYAQVNALIKQHPHPIIVLSDHANNFLTQTLSSYPQFNALSFETHTQRLSVKVICQLKLHDSSIHDQRIDEIYIL